MHEVKVMSLDRIEVSNSEIRILARDTFGDLALVFPQTLWESVLREVSFPSDPSPEELGELRELRQRLGEHARKNSFATVLEDVPLGGAPGKGSGQQFDLVLRPAGLLAVTTGYIILPVVSPEHVARLGVALEEDDFVEQAYLVGAVADRRAFAAADEALKVLSVRGRRCSASRFELAPELWQVLSEKLGWNNVEPVAPVGPPAGADHRKEG
jgi:hypothetical protein